MSLAPESVAEHRHPFRLPRFLQPAAPSPNLIRDPIEVAEKYKHYQRRILIWTTLGYAMFYWVRKNISVAMPVMEQHLGLTHSSLGLFLTLHGVLYGISKFASGFLADRANGKMMMALGLIASAAMNICFGFSSTAIALGVFWMLNGWFQGAGFPPIARLLTHWFPPKQLATKMALWNTSHTLGYASILVLTGFLVRYDWRLCFFVPAVCAVVMALMLLAWLRDTPESVGLPEVEGTHAGTVQASIAADDPAQGEILHYARPETEPQDFKSILVKKVFSNPYIWLFSIANFFVYTIRYGVADWGPTLLKEAKGVSLANGSWMTAAFEVAGLPGIIISGWLTDRFFAGRASRMCIVCMVCCGVALFFFWKAPAGHLWVNTMLLMVAGFFIYGPQALIGSACANLATKRAAATAVGLTGIFGYLSTILSGWGLGALVQHYGWGAGFKGLIAIAAIGTVLFIFALPANAHGYSDR
jgi:OPA family glycerol-3-phosphate transporter-like MFS transporter/OPA family sugar phosphate sensor protein UhpC-like MFS transporter